MRIDAHQHFWKYDRAQYPWIKAGSPIHGDFLPPDLKPLLDQAKIDGCVAVQARQTLEEGRWLLSLSAQHPFIKGVVAWADLRSEKVHDQLVELAHSPRFAGVRHVVQDEPENDFMLGAHFLRGIDRLKEFDLAYDILIYPRQLPAAIELVRKFPEQRFVLDHIAKPPIKDATLSPWRDQIRELAKSTKVFCKISGMVTEADWKKWKGDDFTPYLDVVFEAFGPARLMYGSDWPVCLLAASYEQVYDLARKYCSRLSAAEQDLVFGGTAAKFYRLS